MSSSVCSFKIIIIVIIWGSLALGSLNFHMNFRISSSIGTEEAARILTWILLNRLIRLVQYCLVNHIMSSNPWTWEVFLLLYAYVVSPVQLFVIAWTAAHQSFLSLGFFRQDYWSGLPFPPPGDLSDLWTKRVSHVSCISGGFFTGWVIREVPPYLFGAPLISLNPIFQSSVCKFCTSFAKFILSISFFVTLL